jgi:hypothetical protein
MKEHLQVFTAEDLPIRSFFAENHTWQTVCRLTGTTTTIVLRDTHGFYAVTDPELLRHRELLSLDEENVYDILFLHELALREDHPVLRGCRLTPDPAKPIDTQQLQLHYHAQKRRVELWMVVHDLSPTGAYPDRQRETIQNRWTRVESTAW